MEQTQDRAVGGFRYVYIQHLLSSVSRPVLIWSGQLAIFHSATDPHHHLFGNSFRRCSSPQFTLTKWRFLQQIPRSVSQHLPAYVLLLTSLRPSLIHLRRAGGVFDSHSIQPPLGNLPLPQPVVVANPLPMKQQNAWKGAFARSISSPSAHWSHHHHHHSNYPIQRRTTSWTHCALHSKYIL